MAPLCVLTFNCNRGCAANNATDVSQPQTDFLVTEAQEGRLDVVALQLVTEARVADFTAALGDSWEFRFAVAAAPFGNALISRCKQ